MKNLPITKKGLDWLDEALGLGRFFSAWTPEGVVDFLPSFALIEVAAGADIVTEGGRGREMYVLYEGKVRVRTRRMLVGSKTVTLLGPGDFFGEIGFLTGSPRTATVTAEGACRVFRWSAEDMRRVLEKNEAMGKRLEAAARRRIARLSE